MMNNVVKVIDETIKYIWEYDIKNDYQNGWLLREDTLKNAFYHYLRSKLASLFDENNLRIFTEYTQGEFARTGKRPDMVIAETGEGKKCVCIIEFKYKYGYNTANEIYKDYEKLREYVEEHNIDCKLYMATIWEYEDDPTFWERKNAAWAKDRLTELNASYDRHTGKMNFYICEHKSERCKYK